MNEQELKEVKETFANLIESKAFDLIQADPHQWSQRGCQTCKVISELINRPFGCILYAKQKQS